MRSKAKNTRLRSLHHRWRHLFIRGQQKLVVCDSHNPRMQNP